MKHVKSSEGKSAPNLSTTFNARVQGSGRAIATKFLGRNSIFNKVVIHVQRQ